MGTTNWLLNRSQSGARSITVRASDPMFLDNEVEKYEKKGYERVGQPYTAREGGVYGKTVYYQTMETTKQNAEAHQSKNTIITLIVIAVIVCIAFPPVGIIALLALAGVGIYGFIGHQKNKKKLESRKSHKTKTSKK